MRVRVSLSAVFACLLLTAAAGHAQSPPPQFLPPLAPGFVPPYEIMRTARAAGFDPLSPPLREGATYVLRATDYRGILMRVVIDARTGAIRDANRIVPGPGAYAPAAYGQMGPYGPPPPYGASPYEDGPPPYGMPVRGDPSMSDDPDEEPGFVSAHPPAVHPATRASVTILPPLPLPRPRPAELASGKPSDDVKPPPPNVKPDAKLDVKPDSKPAPKSDVATAPPVVATPVPAATAKPPKPPPSPPIND